MKKGNKGNQEPKMRVELAHLDAPNSEGQVHKVYALLRPHDGSDKRQKKRKGAEQGNKKPPY